MTKIYVDINGAYLGGFDESMLENRVDENGDPVPFVSIVPEGAIEVPNAPSHGSDTWDGSNWVAQVQVPEQITPRQARLALHSAGLLDAVEAALALPENRAAQITWEYALEINRSDQLIATFGALLGLTSSQIDDLFKIAATL
jgi:hypothetical protein